MRDHIQHRGGGASGTLRAYELPRTSIGEPEALGQMRPSYLLATVLVLVACGASPPEAAKVPAATGSAPGACRSVATFISSAAPQLQKEGCAGCHAGTDAGATTALDLTNVGKDNAAACSQALRAVNRTNRPQSAIIQAATGAQAHKGGTVGDAQAFKSALLGWIDNE